MELKAILRLLQGLAAQLGAGLGTPAPLTWDLPAAPLDITQLNAFTPQFGPPQPNPRACCAIGWESSIGLLPDWYAATEALSFADLPGHEYGGPTFTIQISDDTVGHLYTKRGGIIDIGHVRDHADLARYLAVQARMSLSGGAHLELSDEGGGRKVEFEPQGVPPSPELCALLGARISYELAIWHEIVTLFNMQTYSAFSPEDNFSNLLGALVGFKATIDPDHDYDDAIDVALAGALLSLGVVSQRTTLDAVAYVETHWYRYVGGNLLLLRRHFDSLSPVMPWLITDVEVPGKSAELAALRAACGTPSPLSLTVPEHGPDGAPLSSYYTLRFDVDTDDIPADFLGALGTQLTAADFPALLDKARAHILQQLPNGDKPG